MIAIGIGYALVGMLCLFGGLMFAGLMACTLKKNSDITRKEAWCGLVYSISAFTLAYLFARTVGL